MEPLGKVSTPAHAVRKEEESFPNIKGAPSAGPSKPGLAVSTSGTPSPKALPGKPGRERDRLTFFSSLKRKVSGGDQAAIEENGGLHRQVGLGSLILRFCSFVVEIRASDYKGPALAGRHRRESFNLRCMYLDKRQGSPTDA